MPYTTQVKLLDAVTVDTTGEYFEIGDRENCSVEFICANHVSGNGIFTIEVSNDATNWVQYNRLVDNVANSNIQNDTRVASVTLNSNTSKIYFFPNGDQFRYIRAKVDLTTDGTYSAILNAL